MTKILTNKTEFEVLENGDISDGSHSFDELYHHRAMLFACIIAQNKDRAWKSHKHFDGSMWDNYFIVGITTDSGEFSYHYEDSYWDYFDCKEIENAPEWDGYSPEEGLRRLSSMFIPSLRKYTKENSTSRDRVDAYVKSRYKNHLENKENSFDLEEELGMDFNLLYKDITSFIGRPSSNGRRGNIHSTLTAEGDYTTKDGLVNCTLYACDYGLGDGWSIKVEFPEVKNKETNNVQ